MAIIPTTWNQADRGGFNTLSNGNLTTSYTAFNGSNVRSTYGIESGSAYFELQLISRNADAYINLGFWPISRSINTYIFSSTGVVRVPPTQHAVNDIFGVALDVATSTVTVTRNGAALGTATGLTISEPWHAVVGDDNTPGLVSLTANFGQSSFAYSPPGGVTPGLGPAGYELSGTVVGTTGTPVARAIRAHREDTGAYVGGVVSNGTTGVFSLLSPYPGEHTLVAYPVTGENLPALVHRGVTPI